MYSYLNIKYSFSYLFYLSFSIVLFLSKVWNILLKNMSLTHSSIWRLNYRAIKISECTADLYDQALFFSQTYMTYT